MNNNQEDTNIVSGDDLSFLQSIGIAPPSTQTIEEEVVESENVKTDETTQEETQTVSKTPDVNLENTFREELTPNTDYKKSIDVLLKNNVWEDTSIKYGDEEYESISELLNKIEVIQNTTNMKIKVIKEIEMFYVQDFLKLNRETVETN